MRDPQAHRGGMGLRVLVSRRACRLDPGMVAGEEGVCTGRSCQQPLRAVVHRSRACDRPPPHDGPGAACEGMFWEPDSESGSQTAPKEARKPLRGPTRTADQAPDLVLHCRGGGI
jgi:hypothetical protein